MENFSPVFPRYGKRLEDFSTLWKMDEKENAPTIWAVEPSRPPWPSVAEYAHRKEWSRVAVAVRTHFDPEYAKRTQK